MIATTSSCKKEESTTPTSKVYTAEEMSIILNSKTPPSNEELVLNLWEGKVSGLKSGLSTAKVGFPLLSSNFMQLPNNEYALYSAWTIIDNGSPVERGHIADIYDSQAQLIRQEFYIGWNINNPFCIQVNFTSGLQNIGSVKLNFSYLTSYGEFNFAENYYVNSVNIYLANTEFRVSWELFVNGSTTSLGGMKEFHPSTTQQIDMTPEINGNCTHFVIFNLPENVNGEDIQIEIGVMPVDGSYVKDNITLNVPESWYNNFLIPLVFEPGQINYQVKRFVNGFIEYGESGSLRAVLDSPGYNLYNLVELIDINQLVSITYRNTNEILQISNKLNQIPIDPNQYQGNLEVLYANVASWYSHHSNIVDYYYIFLDEFIQENRDNLTYSQKMYIKELIMSQFLQNSYGITNNFYNLVMAYQINSLPENWLFMINQKNDQINELISNL